MSEARTLLKGDDQVIVLAGMIGAGKTRFTDFLAKELGSEPFFESVEDNRLLEKFYADPKRWSFALQIYFLNTRFRSIKKALQHKNNVLDRSIYEDALFTRINFEEGNMSDAEMDTYLDLLDNMMEELDAMPKKSPDLLIYLRGPLDVHLERIKKRGRSYEQVEDNPGLLEYYTNLHSRYDDWFSKYDKSPTLVIETGEVNIDDPEDQKEIIELVKAKLAKIRAS